MPKFEMWGTIVSDIIIEVEAPDRAAAWAKLTKLSLDEAQKQGRVRAKALGWNATEIWQVLDGNANNN